VFITSAVGREIQSCNMQELHLLGAIRESSKYPDDRQLFLTQNDGCFFLVVSNKKIGPAQRLQG